MKTKLLFVLCLILFLSSCEQAFIKEKEEISNEDVFNHLWETVDQKYSFFTDKDIDWDAAYDRYFRQARQAENSIELADILGQMLGELEDGHVNISAGFDVTRYWNWYLDYPTNFNFDVIERNYLEPSADYQISGPLYNTIIDSVGYIYYESFSSSVSTSLMDYIILKFTAPQIISLEDEVAGLIIDVRNNGGGSVNNAFTITNRFAAEKTKVADWYYKNGPDHDDFTEAEARYIEFEGDEDLPFNKPIVVLTNRSTYSAANFFASMMSFLPNVTLIGDTTGGGGGLPINNELPNGWRFRFSATRTIDANGNNIEFGVAPDIYHNLDSTLLIEGRDSMIELAIDEIKNN